VLHFCLGTLGTGNSSKNGQLDCYVDVCCVGM
jgi:hypothetical protein